MNRADVELSVVKLITVNNYLTSSGPRAANKNDPSTERETSLKYSNAKLCNKQYKHVTQVKKGPTPVKYKPHIAKTQASQSNTTGPARLQRATFGVYHALNSDRQIHAGNLRKRRYYVKI